MVDNPTPAVEVTPNPVRIALEDVTPTIAAAFGDDLCLIWSGEWQKYWRDLGQGYTSSASEAGRFTIAGAYACTKHCDPTKQIAFERVSTPSRGGEVEKLREAVQLTIADASYHLRKYRPHCLDALRATLASPPTVEVDHHQTNVMAPVEIGPVTPVSEGAVPAGEVDAEVHRILAMSDDEILAEANVSDVAWARGFKAGLKTGQSVTAASPKPASDTGTRVEAGEGMSFFVKPEFLIAAVDSGCKCCDGPHCFSMRVRPVDERGGQMIGPWNRVYESAADVISDFLWRKQAGRLVNRSNEPLVFHPADRPGGEGHHTGSGKMFRITIAPAASPATATGGVRDHAGSVREVDGHADTEGEAMAMFAHLNCPLCAGSGHVDDAEALGSLIAALLVSLDDIELPDGSGQMGMPASVEDAAGNLAEAIGWDGTKAAALHPVDSRAQGGEEA